ncbi:MAG: outer membrane protein assembly factor BamE [Colwellia sp.]|nr:outer membrane protein assembly factor BamE [Colwellia sp.]
MLLRTTIITIALSLSACSSWVYRIDIPQGNYLEQKSIDKIQIGMTKEQVKFILGSPVLIDTFDNDTWNYVYRFKSGKSKKLDLQKSFTIKFEDDTLISADGDFELSENFNTPFNAPAPKDEEKAKQ